MSTISEITALFRRANTSLKSRMSSVLYEESSTLLRDFRDRAPVDSGDYRSNWRLKKSRIASPSTLASFSLYNDMSYAEYMEEGAEIGRPPWNFGVKARRSGSGKLVIRNGRVWAGGLNPGHSKTVFGAIGPVLVDNNKRLNLLAKNVADAVIGGFK